MLNNYTGEWRLKSGERVVDRYQSHVRKNVREFIDEALARVESRNRNKIEEIVDLGRSLGNCECVRVTPDDEVIWARQLGRLGTSKCRFVKNRQAEPTSLIQLVLHKKRSGYVLLTAYLVPDRDPQDRHYWENHAYIWNTAEVIL